LSIKKRVKDIQNKLDDALAEKMFWEFEKNEWMCGNIDHNTFKTVEYYHTCCDSINRLDGKIAAYEECIFDLNKEMDFKRRNRRAK
jgi:hypothetical protein